eukprot:s571_g36.t1
MSSFHDAIKSIGSPSAQTRKPCDFPTEHWLITSFCSKTPFGFLRLDFKRMLTVTLKHGERSPSDILSHTRDLQHALTFRDRSLWIRIVGQ